MTFNQLPKPVQLVLEITDLEVQVFESFPPQFQVSVYATVPSAGWSRPQLIPYTYVQAPPDGIYDFDFVATRPGGPAAPVVSPIRVRETFGDIDLKGIRVHASHNCREVIFDRATT